jgi:ParB family transcriptional regulator, chromosome partitioning protein
MSCGDELARAVQLDMVRAGCRTTAENYLGQMPKAGILEAIIEAKGESAAQLMQRLKKSFKAREAERILAETDRLPEIFQLPGPGLNETAGDEELMASEPADRDSCPPSSPMTPRRCVSRARMAMTPPTLQKSP